MLKNCKLAIKYLLVALFIMFNRGFLEIVTSLVSDRAYIIPEYFGKVLKSI